MPLPRSALELAAGQTLLGTLGVFVVESGLDPISVVFWRCVIGAFAIGLYCHQAGHLGTSGLTIRTASLSTLTGVLMVANWVMFFAAIERVGIATATIVFHVQPFMVVLLGAALFREAVGASRLAWVALAFAGLLAAIGPEAFRPGADQVYLVGIGCALAGAFSYAWVTLIVRRLNGVQPPVLTLAQCIVGVPLLALFDPAGPAGIGVAQWGWLAGIGLIHTGFAYAMIYGALPGLTTPVIAVLSFLYPASAVLVDALAYGRLIEPLQAAGLALIIVASFGVTLGWRIAVPRDATGR